MTATDGEREADRVVTPRSFWATFATAALTTGPLFGLMMGAYFAVTDSVLGRFSPTRALVTAALTGVTFGVLFGLAMAPLFKGATITLRVAKPDRFDADIDKALQRMGYVHQETTGNLSRYRPGRRAGALAGSLFVRNDGAVAQLTGAWLHIRRLERQWGQ